MLAGAVFAGSSDETYDLNGDTSIDYGDVAYLVETLMGRQIGDANLDGSVDFADLATYYASGGGGWAGADFNGDASVDFADLEAYYTETLPGAPGPPAVPEPTTALLLAIGAVGLRKRIRRRPR